MVPDSLNGPYPESVSQILWADEERVLRRGWRLDDHGKRCTTLFVVPASEHPSRSSLDRFRHEYELRNELDASWAVCPLELTREGSRSVLILEDPGGDLLERLLGAPMDTERFLHLALNLAVTLGKLHQRGFIHKDIKPVHVLVDQATGAVRLTGFGIASRLTRERQSPHQPETLEGTLAYMAPEQTGRMNRSVDSRSDLYALGVMLYRMLTGTLPFAAVDPMEWIHCHLARRPLPPAERLTGIPGTLSAIVMKLLAKRVEDRYQTAAGLERDLRRCCSTWSTRGQIKEFPLGERDTPDRLLIPEMLYGREREVETLLGAFDRAVKGGAVELVLVSGYSGIGKSAVVNELQPVLVLPRGLFASGKFEQYKRDIPYSTLAQAFRSLVQPLLGKSEAELAPWRDAFHESLGTNAKLIVDLVPEMKLIVGEPPPVAELSPQEAQRRFQLVFRRFIGVFARQEHPLALFLDDLQWLDAATLDLLEDLLTSSDLQYLLLIGAYRDNEVDATHPLMRKLQAIRNADGRVLEISLGPLSRAHLGRIIADGLRCELEHAEPLAQLLEEKTGGNPFFAIQFIQSLAEEGTLMFHQDTAQWSWDLDRIRAKTYTDNVVQLMVGRITRLPAETQKALQHLACLGNTAEITHASIALEGSVVQLHALLWPAVRLELVVRVHGSYKFIHDRVQEAAYSLIAQHQRAQEHLRIGRLLAASLPPAKREEAVFELVGQFNRGAALIVLQEEREQLAEWNLIAGRRAKVSTAYVSALKYLIAGVALLKVGAWERCHSLVFALELERAECEFLNGELIPADERLTALSSRTANNLERAALASVHISACLELARPDRAVAVALEYLLHVGIEVSPNPTDDDVRHEYEQIWSHLAGRTIEDVIDLPMMSDPESLATLEVLLVTGNTASLLDENLNCWTICKAVTLSLEKGNCDASCLAYAVLGRAAVQFFRDYSTAFRFGQVGIALIEKRGLNRYQARAYAWYAELTVPWMRHLRTCSDLLRRAFEAANEIGDLTFINFANLRLTLNLLITGDPLSNVNRQAELGLVYAQKARFSGDLAMLPIRALIQMLRGLTPQFGYLNSGQMEEPSFERLLAGNPYLRIHECWYLIRKLQARYLAGEYKDALEASAKARRSLLSVTCQSEESEFHFYSALSYAASCDTATAEERVRHLETLAAHHRQLELWAANCPDNFENRAALVGAELARIQNRDLDAMRLYEKAIRSSRMNGFVQNEGLAYERAATFYRGHGFDEFAAIYLRAARACYAAWGADGKVRQLDRMYPALKPDRSLPGPASTIAALVEGLDLATVIRVSQAVSGEIVLEKLIDTVMRKAMEHAGAERGVLIVPEGDDLQIEAESKTSGDDLVVRLRDASAVAAIPESIVRYVKRTHESVILDDASLGQSFSGDSHILKHRVRSILCLPLLNQAKLTGILYLENNLASHVFTPARIAVLKVLASQAAISLENTRLYRDLEDREAKFRRLVDANILGIIIFGLDGSIVEANDAFLRMLQYSRQDLAFGRVRWRDLTPVESRELDDRALAELKETGTAQPYEKEFLRKDGSRVPVLIGGAQFQGDRNEGVAFVLDLAERKRAAETLRELESKFAHMNRVSLMGELAASLAHEIAQPIASAGVNARAAQNFLDMHPPDQQEIKEALACVVDDVDRAGDIIDRVRDQIKKAPPRKQRFDLNAAINEMIALARSVITRNAVSAHTRLAVGLPPVYADRVQLQQVVLNLILNAVDAMGSAEGEARELLISTEKEDTGVGVAVRDSGPGIDPMHLERVFDAFYTTKSAGVGIGLSICRSIIDAHGGRLWATANEPSGAVFRFTLPHGSVDPGV